MLPHPRAIWAWLPRTPTASKFHAPWAKAEGFSIDGMALFDMDCEYQSAACFRDPISRYPAITPGITHFQDPLISRGQVGSPPSFFSHFGSLAIANDVR
jgi:hypothetical protein